MYTSITSKFLDDKSSNTMLPLNQEEINPVHFLHNLNKSGGQELNDVSVLLS